LRLEKALFNWTIGLSFAGKLGLLVINVALTLLSVLFVLAWTDTVSFDDAQAVCRERYLKV
jgi:hypothetical protein